MDADPSPSSTGSAHNRKERGAIAAQACETCRSRKQRCDEQRPKCGTCQKFKLECQYREPQPTKKDKTLVEILDRLKSLESKVDTLGLRGLTSSLYSPLEAIAISGQEPLLADTQSHESAGASSLQPSISGSPASAHGGPYRYVSAVPKMLAWPVVQKLLEPIMAKIPNYLSAAVGQEASSMFLLIPSTYQPLPNDGIESLSLNPRTSLGTLQLQVPASPASLPLSSSGLNWETMQGLSKAYFDSFNLLNPILDRQSFNATILTAVMSDGLDGGTAATIACLVFALGEVAVAGTRGVPLHAYEGRPSGIKGGSLERPPGLAFFNEARKRMGFSLTECSLENVHMYALAGLYYETCGHHVEFWRMTASASLACQALLTSNPGILATPQGEFVKRSFWYCSMMETFLNLELEVPLTGLSKFEKLVGLPDFSASYGEEDYLCNQATHFMEHYNSQIVLRTLLVTFHRTLEAALGPPTSSVPLPVLGPADQSGEAITKMINQLAVQLDQWKSMLPAQLQWPENQPAAFRDLSHDMFGQGMFAGANMGELTLMFTSDLDSAPVDFPFALDVQVAVMRSRYCYVKYLIHRPFIYKALHHSDLMTREDAEGAAACLMACVKWPITMSPTCSHKRLIPCLYFWSQNLFSILVILRLSQQAPILMRIRQNLCGDGFDGDAAETVKLCIDWLRDLKSMDATARWCWSMLAALYHLDS